MTTTSSRRILGSASLLALLAAPAFAERDGADIVRTVCAACHVENPDGTRERIDAVRKSPEGWEMTVTRMMRNHGVQLDAEDRAAVVRHLADTHGLSLAEAAPYRYILEREPVAFDAGPNDQMSQTCGRCHSYARVGLQRRTPQDWEHLIHFHLGQFPTLEYQALARDRDWWGIAQTEIVPYLAKTYPLGDRVAPFAGDASGRYVLAGRQPGRGDYTGLMELARDGADYAVAMTLTFPDRTETYRGTGRILGAGEWRATLQGADGQVIRQVFAFQDGRFEGRWHHADSDVIGGRLIALAEAAAPQVLAVSPPRLRLGVPTTVRVAHVGRGGDLALPAGVSGEVTRRAEGVTELTLITAPDLPPGPVTVALGGQPVSVVAYATPDRISIVPDRTISRIGGNGGPIPKVPAQFEAMGWLNGPDGQPGTPDDIALGAFDAQWATEDFNEEAARMQDAKFAGAIDQRGLFIPGDAGPNPERPMNTNNAGNLRVTARVDAGGGKVLTAEAQLYATVQRFVDAPVR